MKQFGVIVGILLMLALGLCVIEHGLDAMGDSGMSPDLCAGMLVATLAALLLAGPLINGRLLFDPIRSVYPVSLHIPDPPPKSRSLS